MGVELPEVTQFLGLRLGGSLYKLTKSSFVGSVVVGQYSAERNWESRLLGTDQVPMPC